MRSICVPFSFLALVTPLVAAAQPLSTSPSVQPPAASSADDATTAAAGGASPSTTPAAQPASVGTLGAASMPRVRKGTFEMSLGVGQLRASTSDDSESENAIVFGIGGGVFLSPRLALTARLVGSSFSEGDVTFASGFVGPAVQCFVDEHIWVGGGLGLGFVRISNSSRSVREDDVGVDLRAGYTINPDVKHSFTASVEVTRVEISDIAFTSFSVLAGYQFQ